MLHKGNRTCFSRSFTRCTADSSLSDTNCPFLECVWIWLFKLRIRAAKSCFIFSFSAFWWWIILFVSSSRWRAFRWTAINSACNRRNVSFSSIPNFPACNVKREIMQPNQLRKWIAPRDLLEHYIPCTNLQHQRYMHAHTWSVWRPVSFFDERRDASSRLTYTIH